MNAVSVREGGPRVVLLKLLSHLIDVQPEFDISVAAPPTMCEELRHLAVATQPVAVGQSPLGLLKWYEAALAAAAARWRADVLFSVTNYLPLRRLSIPTLLLEQHAGHFSPVFDHLMHGPNMPLGERLTWRPRRAWVRRSVETATVLTVQTAALADAVAASTCVPRSAIRVIPHGPGWVDLRAEVPAPEKSKPVRIGCVSKTGIQKNFSTLFKAVKILADRGQDVRLLLTLDQQEPLARATLAEADRLGIAGLIDNRGEVDPFTMTELYDSLDIFVFPSLCESFGVPMVEAMSRGLCIVVADTLENREIVGAAGTSFPALDADRLAMILGELCDSPDRRHALAQKSLTRARDFSWRKAAVDTSAALKEAVAIHVR